MEIAAIIPHIEALIFASEKPLSTLELADLVNNALGFIEDRATLDQVETAIEGIREKYASEFYAFEMRASGGGWQFLTKKDYHKTVALLNGEKFLKRLSVAALETLAIIAYKQPITKSEIEIIRGVNCDYAVQKLLEKELVVIAGRNENAVGKPLIYTTSKSFMDYFGINSPEDLPKIREVLMEEIVAGTRVSEDHESDEEDEITEGDTLASLLVTEKGDIIEHDNLIATGEEDLIPGDKTEESEIFEDDLHEHNDLQEDEIVSDEIASEGEIATDEIASDEIASDEIASDEIASDEIATDGEIANDYNEPTSLNDVNDDEEEDEKKSKE